ncbi:MAG: HD domain-containing protein [Candidatus Methanomethylophilaceae archaeon]|nr:HD domain-containing protein [Candidatus Methanomethylophilaceae archaeon]
MTTKTVHDPIHGSIVLDGVFFDMMDRHEIQRLRSIRQLGLSNVVFPGANHTRFEHSLGVYHLAGRMAESLGLASEESDTIRAAAMLHDVCHPPFSHTLERLMESASGMDHMMMSRALIMGDVPSFMERDRTFFDGCEPLAVMLEDAGISPDAVCDLIINPCSDLGGLDTYSSKGNVQSFFASKDYAHQIIHGPVDADQMDYLLRDAHYTGVIHGAVDKDRILSQMAVHNGKMVLHKGGITSAEGLMVARTLMYSSIYYHKTVKIVEAMLRRAIEISDLDLSNLYLMTDADLTSMLLEGGGRSADLMRSVLNRRLYKKAKTIYTVDASESFRTSLVRYVQKEKRSELESEIAHHARIDPAEVIVDIPSESSLLSKVRVGKTDVSILDGDKVRSLTRYSSVAKALQSRDPIDWCLMVSAPEYAKDAVKAATEKVLAFDDTDRS